MSELLKPTEIPLPKDKLLLCDLDKTLIDTKYQITDDRIFEEISRVQSLGWCIGLNSDTPLESLQVWRKRFGMNGPIIAERGSIVWLPETEKLFVVNEWKEYFENLRERLVIKLSKKRIPFFLVMLYNF